MRLLLVTQVIDRNDPSLGFFHDWIEELAKGCEHVEVICLREGSHQLPANVCVHSLGKERGERSSLTYAFRFLVLIWKLRDKHDAVLVHMNPEYVVLGGVWWKLLRKRVGLWYVHKSVTFRLKIASLLADFIFTASPESFRLPSSKLRVMGHGINLEPFDHVQRMHDDTDLKILSIGRISRSKRILDILDVLDVLSGQGIEFSCMIVGAPVTSEDKAYEEQVCAAIQSRPYANRVTMAGPAPYEGIAQIYAGATALLHLSTTGSLDKVVLEAMACGTPVVSTSEAFAEAPILHVRSDRPEEVAAAIMQARTVDPEPLKAYVRSNHSLQTLIPKILSAYEECD